MPGNRSCAVAACPSPQDVHYHTFPVKNQETCRRWVEACRRPVDHVNVKNARVCANHFRPDDYEPDLMARLMPHVKPKKRLKTGVIPSLKLTISTTTTTTTTSGAKPPAATDAATDAAVMAIVKSIVEDGQGDQEIGEDRHLARIKLRKDLMEELLKKAEFKTALPDLLEAYQKRSRCSNRGRGRGQKDSRKMNSVSRQVKEVRQAPSGASGTGDVRMKSLAQRAVESSRRNPRWSVEAIVNGLVVRSLSRGSFRYLRLHTDLPVPPLGLLRSWTERYRSKPGVQDDELARISQTLQAESKSGLAYLTFVQAKAVPEKGRKRSGTQEGPPPGKVQVALLKGITENWECLIYVGFDSDPVDLRLLLEDLIARVERFQIQVWALVLDFASINPHLLSLNTLDGKQFFLTNPVDTSRSVFCVPDFRQLLKLLKTHVTFSSNTVSLETFI